jgi:hypothetical protein
MTVFSRGFRAFEYKKIVESAVKEEKGMVWGRDGSTVAELTFKKEGLQGTLARP